MRCCLCSSEMVAEGMSMCFTCAVRELPSLNVETRKYVDRCSTCMRYSVPPSGWIHLRYEGPEMLAYLLKKTPELARLKLADAFFNHSEEHSKRVRITVSFDRSSELREYSQEHIETTEIVWTIRGKHCLDCARAASNQTWSSVVQLRQKSAYKSTLLIMEQAILKAGLHNETTDIKGVQDGIDFFFNAKTPALKLVRFIEETLPARVKYSEQLVTLDKKSSNSRYKLTFSVEVANLNKNDLIHLPEKLAKKLALSQVCAVLRVSKFISFVDTRGTVKDVGKIDFFKHINEITLLSTDKDLIAFDVAEIEDQYRQSPKTSQNPKSPQNPKSSKSSSTPEAETLNYGKNSQRSVVLVKEDGEMVSAQTFLANVSEGTSLLGYDLSNLHTNLEIDSPIFVLKKKVLIDEKWRIRRITGEVHSHGDARALLEELREFPALCKSVNVYDENNRLVDDFKSLRL
ncbi:nonsense-mediated mRNA decay protein 3 [Nematocida displodere]|uniref:60S ribosomal export protein NMD3 n=1 Tax=Nematocida displodere TaxID=1805483 RepID=A0A177EE34_9MICR|nr:nonsense-mediated mRNA decay protein 3 [Nematocida displodere]